MWAFPPRLCLSRQGAVACPQRRVLPGVAGRKGWTEGGGDAIPSWVVMTASLAHPAEMRKGPWWAGGTRIQTSAFEELTENICLAQPPTAALLLDH